MSRTERYAGHRLIIGTGTSSIFNMSDIVVPIADQALVDHIGGLIANGAVRRFPDRKRRLFHQIQRFHRRFSIQHIPNQLVQLSEANPARHAFSACLRMAQLQKRPRHIHRTESRRAGFDPAFQILIKPLHHDLRPVWRNDLQSAHKLPSPFP